MDFTKIAAILNRRSYFAMRRHRFNAAKLGPVVEISMNDLHDEEFDTVEEAGFQAAMRRTPVYLMQVHINHPVEDWPRVKKFFEGVRPYLTGVRAEAVDSWNGWEPEQEVEHGPHPVS